MLEKGRWVNHCDFHGFHHPKFGTFRWRTMNLLGWWIKQFNTIHMISFIQNPSIWFSFFWEPLACANCATQSCWKLWIWYFFVVGTFEGSRTQVISRVYPGFLATRKEKVYLYHLLFMYLALYSFNIRIYTYINIYTWNQFPNQTRCIDSILYCSFLCFLAVPVTCRWYLDTSPVKRVPGGWQATSAPSDGQHGTHEWATEVPRGPQHRFGLQSRTGSEWCNCEWFVGNIITSDIIRKSFYNFL